MSDADRTTRRPRRPAWLYISGGAVVVLLLYGFLFRRGVLDTSLWGSPVRILVIALLGGALGWLASRIDLRSR